MRLMFISLPPNATKIRETAMQGVEFPARQRLLLVYVLLGLQLSRQPIQIALLVVWSCCHRPLHFRRRIVKFALRAVHPCHSGMHEPLIGMFLCVFSEDCKRFLASLLALQLASIHV